LLSSSGKINISLFGKQYGETSDFRELKTAISFSSIGDNRDLIIQLCPYISCFPVNKLQDAILCVSNINGSISPAAN
jgi:hypothetical protein